MRQDPLDRRHLLGAAGVGAAALLLGACGSDTSDRYGDGENGFVAGDGVTTEIKPEDRADPVEFSGTTYEDEKFSSVDERGSVLVLNVWYASCAPCRKEAPDLVEIAGDYKDKGVDFVGINVRDEAGPALAFQKKYELPYPSLPDLDSSILYSLRGQVSPNAVPSTLVLDVEGRVAARISGAADPSILRSMLDTVVDE
jgi:thiol-disulfide isomerase/thioredoxin